MNYAVDRTFTAGSSPSVFIDVPGRGCVRLKNTGSIVFKVGFSDGSTVACTYPIEPGETLELAFSEATEVFGQQPNSLGANAEGAAMFIETKGVSYELVAQ